MRLLLQKKNGTGPMTRANPGLGRALFALLVLCSMGLSSSAFAQNLNLSISAQNGSVAPRMVVTGQEYPPNTVVSITVTNLTTGQSTSYNKTTTALGAIKAEPYQQGELSAAPGDKVQASTTKPPVKSAEVLVPGADSKFEKLLDDLVEWFIAWLP